jgi:hypothetical protein
MGHLNHGWYGTRRFEERKGEKGRNEGEEDERSRRRGEGGG